MPRYFFDLVDCGDLTVDPRGMDLADAAEARNMAVKGARQIMALEMTDGRLNLDCAYVILDGERKEIGRVLFRQAVLINGL